MGDSSFISYDYITSFALENDKSDQFRLLSWTNKGVIYNAAGDIRT